MPKLFVIQINVTDMDTAIEFYCDKLGFKIKESYYPDIVELSHYDSQRVSLILNRVARLQKLDYPNATQTLLGLQTDNLEDSIKTLSRKGVKFVRDEPQPFPGGAFAALEDPFGNVIELCEPVPQTHRDQRAQMAKTAGRH